jgi:hypothetical protein
MLVAFILKSEFSLNALRAAATDDDGLQRRMHFEGAQRAEMPTRFHNLENMQSKKVPCEFYLSNAMDALTVLQIGA